MKFFITILFSITFVCIIHQIRADDDDQPEERDPWEKSTDRYMNNQDQNANQNLNVDVTEESESEVHTEKKAKIVLKKKNRENEDEEPQVKEGVDNETKEQFEDAVDETDPAENIDPKTSETHKVRKPVKPKQHSKHHRSKHHHTKGHKKEHLQKKTTFNYQGDFYPGSLWEYPYPYYHPQYGCGSPIDCPCKQGGEAPPTEAKEDEPEEEEGAPAPPKPPALKPPTTKRKQLIPNHYYGPPSAGWGGFQPGHTGGGWGAPYWYKKRSHTHRQLIPNHYYGPPSAGWGGFQPGHTGGGWGAPYWYKKKRSHTHRQLIPNHYYGPPSAGWGGFQPGHTGGGWGAPYWYKKKRSHTHRQLIPNHYYGPPSAGWGGFQPGHTGGGWGAPYWYKKRTHMHRHPKSHSHRQLIPNHYYGPPSAGWGGFQPGHTGGGWGAPYWYKSKVVKPVTTKGERKFTVEGNDPDRMGFSGNCGWDSGCGNGFGHSWGQPNVYGWGPYAHHYGGPEDIDYSAWHGPDSFGSKGWGGHGWLGNYGWMHGDEHERGFGSGFAGWGNAGGDMAHLDEKIGEGDFEGGMEGFAHGQHGGNGHLGHNSFFQGIGYGLASHGTKSKSKSRVPITQNVEINFGEKPKNQQFFGNKQPLDGVHHTSVGKVNNALPLKNLVKSAKKTVNTRAENEKPVTQ